MLWCKVGVITPSYNKHLFLGQAIDSVLSQSHRDIALLVVNDYANKSDSDIKRDELESMVRERDDSRIILSHNKGNLGIAASRNQAIKWCIEQGLPYIFFLDHDDIWTNPDKLKNQLKVLKKWEVALLWTQFDIIDRVGNIIGFSHNPIVHEEMIKSATFSCPILMSSMWVNVDVFKKEWLLAEHHGADDWEFMLRILRRYRWQNLQEKSTAYRMYAESTSCSHWHQLIKGQIQMIRHVWKEYDGYRKALFLSYIKLLIPTKYKAFFRNMKKYILPSHNTLTINK